MVENKQKRTRQVIASNNLIWHYTSMPVLENFLQGKVALTHFRFLNDSKDLAYGLEVLREIAHKSGSKHLLHAVVENPFADALTKEDNYLFCLSRESDNLYQWRSYATNGGIAIGFRRADLYNALYDAMEENPKINSASQMFAWLKCRYDVTSTSSFIERLVERLDAEDQTKKDDFASIIKPSDAFINFMARLIEVMMTQKHESFKEEREERFVLTGNLRQDIEVLGGKPRVVLQSAGVSKAIGQIKISPHGDVVRNELLVELLRDKCGLSYEITKSDSTYNGL